MQIQDIKERLTLQQVLSHYNLKPDRNSRLCCPFHSDKTPSLQVYHETNTVYCFSSNCKTHGKSLDVIDFIMHKENVSKHEAIEKAKTLCGETKPTTQPIKTKQQQVKTQCIASQQLLTKLFKSFQNGLKSGKANKPKEYLQQRLLNAELLELGYNSGQFHHRGKLSKEDTKTCIDAGLLIEYKGYTPNGNEKVYTAFAKDCIIFPLKDKSRNIVSIYGRSLSDKKGTKHYYLKSRSGLYPCYPSCPGMGSGAPRLILTEAIIDAATLLQLPKISKQYQILSLYGTNGLTAEHTEAVSQLKGLEEVIFFFDGDGAGRAAIEKYSQELKELLPKIELSEVETPGGEDVNSLHLAYNNEEYFLELLEERKPLTQPKSSGSTPNKDKDFFLSNEKPVEKKKEGVQLSPIKTKLLTDNPEQLIYETAELKITIWGGIEKENLSRLKISMHIKSKANKYKSFRDDVNLYSHGNTQKLIQNISETLETSTATIIKTITELTEELEAYRLQERQAQVKALQPKLYEMSETEKQAAQSLLKSKGLGKKTLELIQQSGLIGEEKNGLLLFFLYTSRLMDEPLHAIIFGKSGSGKTYLQTKISECLPEESVRTITSLTENTLYYSAKGFWKHKVLLIEDLEGVYNAFLPLREFMSKQSITKLTTDKDAKGNNVQKLLTVEGPICVSGATTQGNIYEDNANRSFLLHIDESPNHLNHVMEYQRKMQAGLVNENGQDTARQLLKNSQRLLKKVKVINPYAIDLRIPDCVFKKLRTNTHYLKLIEIITFYNQYRRKFKKNQKGEYYIETSLDDIELANWLVKETLLQKSDELNSDIRYFFESLKEQAKKANRTTFFAKDVRKNFRMHPMKLSRYLYQLESRSYIKKISNRQSGFEYEILSFDDYELLKEGINVLDKILENIKTQNNGKNRNNKDLHTSFTSASQNSENNQSSNN